MKLYYPGMEFDLTQVDITKTFKYTKKTKAKIPKKHKSGRINANH